jgi:tetratricopeptide (TPR) repeat protein
MEEHNQGATEERTTSTAAKVLLGKVLNHKLFSDQVLYWLVLASAFLLPLFFIPGDLIAPEFAKMLLLEVAVLFGILSWGLGRLRDGILAVPKSFLLLVSVLLLVQFVVSAIASPAPFVSFIGSGYDLGSVNAFLTLFLLMFLSSIVFVNRDRVLSLYLAILAAGILTMIYHLLRHLFGADFLDFGLFTSNVSTPVGKWNDFASLIGAILVLSLLVLYFFPQNKMLRIPANLIAIVSIFFLLLVDFTVLWLILGAIMAVIITYSIYEGESAHKVRVRESAEAGQAQHHRAAHKRIVGHLPVLASVVFVLAIIYGFGISTTPLTKDNKSIAGIIGTALHSSPYAEVVLTPEFTYDIVTETIKDSPLFGTGPNRFGSGYLLYKTSDMNRTPFWDSTFDFGLGRIPTYFGTTGLIGVILWVLFFAMLFWKGKKIIKLFAKDRIAAFLALSLFLLTLYFWSLAFFYLPNVAIFAFAFLMTGALIAYMTHEGVLELITVDFTAKRRASFWVTPLIIVLIIGSLSAGVLLFRQVSSLVAFRDAQLALTAGKIDEAGMSLLKAARYAERDLYHRSLSNVALIKLQQLSASGRDQNELITKANEYVSNARSHAERAIQLDPTNFENYLQMGGVYDTLGSLGIEGTEQFARENYSRALTLNPKSPRILFIMARLELASGNRSEAKKVLYQALTERPNFLEAISLITQLELEDKNPEAAISALQAGVVVEPGNFLLRFALGYLYYSSRDYDNAIVEFRNAVLLNPVYADAKYFLGLSYARNGLRSDAIAQFEDVLMLNPDNKDVAQILRNLKAGRDPFTNVTSTPTQPVADALEGLNSGGGEQ